MNPTKSAAPIPKIHRVALVDNDPRALESLSLLIEAKVPTAYVVWTATSGDEAIERCQRNDDNLNLLVLDMSMEGLQGPAICHRIRLMDRHLPILGITSFSINSYRSRLMEAGAQGLIGKEDSDQLAKAIERLCGGNVMEGFEPPALANVRIRREEETSPRLTVREEQIIFLCADGMLDREIAERLDISESTGFPSEEDRIFATINGESCVVPYYLTTNVRNLHRTLFGEEDYAPSPTVEEINDIVNSYVN